MFLNQTLASLKNLLVQSTNPTFYPKFDHFSGSKPHEAQAWLKNCKRMLELCKIDQTNWVAPIVVCLQGQASTWYQARELANNGVQLTWLEFEKAFEERWYEDDKQKFFRVRQLINNWKWNNNFEEFYAVYERIRAIVSEKEYPENLLMEEFEKRLPEDYCDRTELLFEKKDIPSLRKGLLNFHHTTTTAVQHSAEVAVVTTKSKNKVKTPVFDEDI